MEIHYEDVWAMSAFKALDTDLKGFLYKDEILGPIIDQGV